MAIAQAELVRAEGKDSEQQGFSASLARAEALLDGYVPKFPESWTGTKLLVAGVSTNAMLSTQWLALCVAAARFHPLGTVLRNPRLPAAASRGIDRIERSMDAYGQRVLKFAHRSSLLRRQLPSAVPKQVTIGLFEGTVLYYAIWPALLASNVAVVVHCMNTFAE